MQENFCAFKTSQICAAIRWDPDVQTVLPTLGGNNAETGKINSKGEIAGIAETAIIDPTCPKTTGPAGTGPQYFDYEAVVWVPGTSDMRRHKLLAGDTVKTIRTSSTNNEPPGS